MSPRSHPQIDSALARRATALVRVAVAMLLAALACLGLAACGGSSARARAEEAAAAQNAKVYRSQRAEALELVSCAHRHGIPLPQPTAKNSVITSGVNLKVGHRQVDLSNCYHRVVAKAARIQAAERQAEEAARKRRGEPPPPREASSESSSATFAREREQLVKVVSCARRHGIHLPEPDAHNNINIRGLKLENQHDKSILNACFGKVVSAASREEREQQRERENGPRRLGEEPTG